MQTRIVMPVSLSLFLAVGFFGATFVKCTTMTKNLGIVYPQLIESRNDGGEKVIKISESIMLNLKKSSIVSKEFLLRTYQDDIMEHNYLDGEILEESLYHDSESFASVIVLHQNGLKVEGIVSPNFGIKPMLTGERSADGRIPHAFYELPPEKTNQKGAGSNTLLSSVYSGFYPQHTRRPKKVYLELMILVDSYFRWQFDTKDSMLTYLLISINAVNLKYLSISDPEVQIIFRAVEVFNHKVEDKFLVRNGTKNIKDRDTLFALQKYVIHNYEHYYTFDALYYITGLDMGYYYFGGFDTDVQGIAFLGGVCTIDKLGMGEDRKDTYSGVRITAHELGHLSPYGDCLETKNATRRINKKLDTVLLPGEKLDRDKVCQLAFPTLEDIRFVTDNGVARCRASCYSTKANKTFWTILPDHSPCNETIVKGKQYPNMVCVNGDCRPKLSKPSQYPVKPCISLTC
uniref:Reprolysin n=1 Tax=Rhipicephalus appendiculatus TaxID=34631 RepID=A0A131YTR5_RHIAP